MISRLLKRESSIGGVLVLLFIPYAGTAFRYPVVELQGPFLSVFLPIILGTSAVFVFAAKIATQPLIQSLRVGAVIGGIASLVLFLSNFIVSAPCKEAYVVSEIRIGRSKSINWVIDTPERKGVVLNIRLAGVTTRTSPNDVKLNIYKGWLGFYFGGKT